VRRFGDATAERLGLGTSWHGHTGRLLDQNDLALGIVQAHIDGQSQIIRGEDPRLSNSSPPNITTVSGPPPQKNAGFQGIEADCGFALRRARTGRLPGVEAISLD
jgi:hypothetical protein